MAENANGVYVKEEEERLKQGKGREKKTLPGVLNRIASAILFPELVNAGSLLRRVKVSVVDNAPLLPEASRNSAKDVLLWTRRGSPFRAIFVISVRIVQSNDRVLFSIPRFNRVFLLFENLHSSCNCFHQRTLETGNNMQIRRLEFKACNIVSSGDNELGKSLRDARLSVLMSFNLAGTIIFVTLTGLLVFLLFLLAATINAIVISLLISLATAGGFLALFFAFVAAIYIAAFIVVIFAISVSRILAMVAILITTGWIGFIYTVWLVTRKSFGFAAHLLGVTGSAISSYTTAGHAHHPIHKDSN
ncbi:hypothetical protein VNO77_43567 [Canavalia gladiata]|uniref:Uncharacterized protein n=1 Tax=Canavalia gladiata TaxID=3824 RepID=A0AAN9PPJ5_CANGL